MYIRLNGEMGTVLFVVLLLAVIAFIMLSPMFTIWALNTLFHLEIPVNFWTYVSMLWLHLILAVRSKEGKSNG